MPNLATWIRPKDAKSFRAIFSEHPEIKVWNARNRDVRLDQMDGLLLTGGSDISPEFLRQEVPDPSVLDKDIDPERDRWFHAASTIKVAVLLAVFRAADTGRLRLNDSLHVRNRFFSAADGTVFHVAADREDRKSVV